MLNPLTHPICLAVPERLVDSAWHEHVPFAMYVVDILRPQMVVELGVHSGVSYCAFCQAVSQLAIDARCFGIDTWEGDAHAGFYGPEVLADLREHHDPKYGGFSRLIQSTFADALAHFGDRSIDLLHIDAYHTYDAVKRDFESWLRKMTSNGVILFHDINVRERDFGVRRFWDEVKQSGGHFEFIHGHGLGVLALGETASPELQALLNASPEESARIRQFFFQLGNRITIRYELRRMQQTLDNARIAATRHETERDQAQSTANGLLVQVNDQKRIIETLQARLSEQQSTTNDLVAALRQKNSLASSISTELFRIQQLNDHLATQLDVAQRTLTSINHSLGGRLLGIYGRRVKYPYLLPLYRAYGRVKHRYLLPVYRTLGLAEKPARPQKQPDMRGVDDARGDGPTDIAVEEISEGRLPRAHSANVDIIICVHNALEDVKRCLKSVIEHTIAPYSLVIVDDGSDSATSVFLREWASVRSASLIRNEIARGYTFAANQALSYSTSPYVVLLNSDTIVSPGWLDSMVACAESDSRIGLVGPLSNAATWQSVPEVIHDGEFANNSLPPQCTVLEMADCVARYSSRIYPRIPFLNGFCLMIKRQVLEQIGIFDEDNFGAGYGEENDYCVRARIAGWDLAVADDCYVYHAESRSYSHQRRYELSRRAVVALEAKHDPGLIQRGVEVCRDDRVMQGIRARTRVAPSRDELIRRGASHWFGKRVLFLLPIPGAGGGGNVVLDEAEAMRSMGVEASVLNLESYRIGFERSYPDNYVPVIYIKDQNEIADLAGSFDAMVATWHASVDWLAMTIPLGSRLRRVYYIQDFEPLFFPPNSIEYQLAWNTYDQYADLLRLTKTEWNRQMVQTKVGVDSVVVGPSVNIDLFRPRPRRDLSWPERPIRVAAMIRPSTKCRAPEFTLSVLRDLHRSTGGIVDIVVFGSSSHDLRRLRSHSGFPVWNAGVLNRRQVANLLNEVDIFVDFSSHQAMGLTAMEAMCCGAAVIVPTNGGASSFAAHERNALVIDTSSNQASIDALRRLVTDHELRGSLQHHAIHDSCEFFRERAAYNSLNAMFAATMSAAIV